MEFSNKPVVSDPRANNDNIDVLVPRVTVIIEEVITHLHAVGIRSHHEALIADISATVTDCL